MAIKLSEEDLHKIADYLSFALLARLEDRFDRLEEKLDRLSHSPNTVTRATRPTGTASGGRACGDCGQSIVFMLTRAGKAIPCDLGNSAVKDGAYNPGKHKCHHDTCPKKKQ